MDNDEELYYFSILPDDLMKELFLYLDLLTLITYDFIYGVPDKPAYWIYRLEKLFIIDEIPNKFSKESIYTIIYLKNLIIIKILLNTALGNFSVFELANVDARNLY